MSAVGLSPSQLPDGVAALLAAIDRGDVLGASRQLSVLGDCLLGLADARAREPDRLRTDVTALADHVERTRGASSKAVSNGMALMTRPLLDADGAPDVDADADLLCAAVASFRSDLDRWMGAVRRHGASLLQDVDVVLAYDYSSTVSQVVTDLARGRDGLRVLVPEARSLDGGVKYLPDWRAVDVTVHLVPDAAVSWALSSCDAVLVGAETLSAEGGCYNTIGTATAATAAARAGVPVHVLSILLKTDLAARDGARPIPTLDFLARLAMPSMADGRPRVRGDFPDLDYTPPADISSVVTERGALAPGEVRAAAADLLEEEPRRA